MSYAESLAKDRDKYLRQRNALARQLRIMCSLAEDCFDDDGCHQAALDDIATARAELTKIDVDFHNAPGGLALLGKRRRGWARKAVRP